MRIKLPIRYKIRDIIVDRQIDNEHDGLAKFLEELLKEYYFVKKTDLANYIQKSERFNSNKDTVKTYKLHYEVEYIVDKDTLELKGKKDLQELYEWFDTIALEAFGDALEKGIVDK